MVQKSLSTLILLVGSIRLKKEECACPLLCTFSLRNITKAIIVEIFFNEFFDRD